MNPAKEFEQALVEQLEAKGVLNKQRAEIRAQLVSLLGEPAAAAANVPRPNQIIHSLIHEYLDFHELNNTKMVLEAETTLVTDGRDEIERYLGVRTEGDARKLPLLVSLVFRSTGTGPMIPK